jgi:hypothetical protein
MRGASSRDHAETVRRVPPADRSQFDSRPRHFLKSVIRVYLRALEVTRKALICRLLRTRALEFRVPENRGVAGSIPALAIL